MSRMVRRFEVLLPLRFNDGTPVPHATVVDTLIEFDHLLARSTISPPGTTQGPANCTTPTSLDSEKHMDVRLQPLRIPTGWLVHFNNGLWEIDPVIELIPEEDRWWIFKQDMLQMNHSRFNRVLDLGWYPEGDLVVGHYRLVVYEGDFRGRLVHQFDTRDRLELVREIERLLAEVCSGKL